jgi:hypothetical protein
VGLVGVTVGHAFTPVWDLGGVDLASYGAKMARLFSCRAYSELTGAPVLGLKFVHNGERSGHLISRLRNAGLVVKCFFP